MPSHRAVQTYDLFAGVGGIRLAWDQAADALGLETLTPFASEWDKFAAQTYAANFDGQVPWGDIRADETRAALAEAANSSGMDVLLAGFPCQPFSLAGVSKKASLGRPHGFADQTQGTLFHEIAAILEEYQPAAFMLENVKHLLRHAGGKTWDVIAGRLDELPYTWDKLVIKADVLVPQRRERVYIIGFHKGLGIKPRFPLIEADRSVRVRDILHEHRDEPDHIDEAYRRPGGLDRYTLTPRLWEYLQGYAEKHARRGNGFGFGLVDDLDGTTRTLSARYHKDGSEILIPQEGQRPRRLTPRECARLQGFPDDFQLPCSDTQSYRQMGNSVSVPVVQRIAEVMLEDLRDSATFQGRGWDDDGGERAA